MPLKTLFGRNRRAGPAEDTADRLYAAIVAQARHPAFYQEYGVPDTVDGRFEMIALHAFLLLHRLKRDPERTARLSQTVFDTMFLDMDASLREMGAGDLGVGRRVKHMATGFYGRIAAYEAGLVADDSGQGADAALGEALRRNVYGTVQPQPDRSEDQAAHLAAYMRQVVAVLAAQPLDALLAGRIEFPVPNATLRNFG
ncbi:ubiquinol-cytochrome C chaperone family protein [Rhodospirillaceae bacterium SYSU D60014]|uniref:ubiquinol-cytochrome C chaperone family protein n=1 Tax=Virgifigura deserti TaxID=2268457 RepID=UPI000E66C5EA